MRKNDGQLVTQQSVTQSTHLPTCLVGPSRDTRSNSLPIVVLAVHADGLDEEVIFVLRPWFPDAPLFHLLASRPHVLARREGIVICPRRQVCCTEFNVENRSLVIRRKEELRHSPCGGSSTAELLT